MAANVPEEEWTAGRYNQRFPPGTIPLEKRGSFELCRELETDILLVVIDKKHGEIILHPRPTADPNDPLNWPKW